MHAARTMAALLVGLGLSIALSAQAQASSPTQALVRLCFEDTPLPPWRTRNRVGLYFDLLRDVARSVGVRVEFSPQPWPYCQNEVYEGRMDGAFAAAYGPERLGKFV